MTTPHDTVEGGDQVVATRPRRSHLVGMVLMIEAEFMIGLIMIVQD
jgi:hypothetical protein